MKQYLLKLILLFCSGLLLTTTAIATELMLPKVYTEQSQIDGWLMSEKLDGVRGYWDGHQLLSKQGNRFYTPQAFIRDLPPFPLEGEIWGGRGQFENTVATVTRHKADDNWIKLKFAIFDVPKASGNFLARMAQAENWFKEHPSATAFIRKPEIKSSRIKIR